MKNSSARLLEFNGLRDLLRGYTASDLGRGKVSELQPSIDLDWIQSQQQLTAEIREFRRVGGHFEFAALSDISQLLEKSRISGAAIETMEIRDVITLVDRAAEWREIAFKPPQAMKQDWSAVRNLSGGIADFTDFLRGFRNKILPDGTLDDKASPALASIRREIEKQRRAIQQSLQSILRRLAEGDALQEDVVTIRGVRFQSKPSTSARFRASCTAPVPVGRRFSWSRLKPSNRTMRWFDSWMTSRQKFIAFFWK